MSWSVLLDLSLIFHDGLYRQGQECSSGSDSTCSFIRWLKFKKTTRTGCAFQFIHTSIHVYVHALVRLRVYVCANKPSSVLNHSGAFVYPGSADVKTPSALNGQTKRTHLGEIKQKLSWPPLSPRPPSTLCLSMPSPLLHNVFRNVALPHLLRLCNAFLRRDPHLAFVWIRQLLPKHSLFKECHTLTLKLNHCNVFESTDCLPSLCNLFDVASLSDATYTLNVFEHSELHRPSRAHTHTHN